MLPLGSGAHGLKLLPALIGAAGVGLCDALGPRLAAGAPLTWLAGIVAAAALAVAPLPWHWATIAGVRSGAVAEVGWLMVAAVGLLGALECDAWTRRRGDAATSMAWLGLATGVALAHHRSGALALPGIALALAGAPALWRLPRPGGPLAAGLRLPPPLRSPHPPFTARQGPPAHPGHPATWDG